MKRSFMMSVRKILAIIGLIVLPLFLTSCSATSALDAPGISLSVQQDGQPQEVATGVQLLVLLTVLSVAPSILILATSFTRIVIVLSMVRTAIGTPTIPPNQVILGLSLILTFFIMAPTITKIDQTAIQPFINKQINQDAALKLAIDPIREFMFKQTREKDIQLFMNIGGDAQPAVLSDIPTEALFPAYIISELRTAFTMGFILYIPFLVIDLVISSVLLSMGMMMLPPSLVSLPFKVLLFIMVDGWYLITRSLTLSFIK
ncbi:MAG TPA: flagellar type III secretion system pore protein FliP [Leptolinea sp.]